MQALVVYPMNALANSQAGELEKFLCRGYPNGTGPVTFARYTGQETDEQKQQIIAHPPDILLTNYVMLELILTRPQEKPLIAAARHLRFLVLDELHTYRGRQGADVARLVRRTREAFATEPLQCVLTYGHAGRVNLGWARRSNKEQHGFVLDVERGYWTRNQQDVEDDDQDPQSARIRRVIP